MRRIQALTKSCVLCGETFSQRKASGGLMHMPRWLEKKTCSNTCHLKYSWQQRQEPVDVRFWRQVDKGGANKCWEWLGGKRDPQKGYGGFHLKGRKMMRAHRMAYILTYGEIDADLVVRHKCDNPPCCNPNHLELGTIADNNCDRDSRGRHVALSRDYNGRTKVSTMDLANLREEYAALPFGPSGKKHKQGTVAVLAKKYGICVPTLCALMRI